AKPVYQSIEIRRGLELDHTAAPFAAFDNFGRELSAGKFNTGASFQAAAGTDERLPHEGLKLANEQDFDPTARCAGLIADRAADETGRKDPGVVKDEDITRVQIGRQFVKGGIGKRTSVAVDNEEAGAVATVSRLLCDQAFRKAIVKVGNQHCDQ